MIKEIDRGARDRHVHRHLVVSVWTRRFVWRIARGTHASQQARRRVARGFAAGAGAGAKRGDQDSDDDRDGMRFSDESGTRRGGGGAAVGRQRTRTRTRTNKDGARRGGFFRRRRVCKFCAEKIDYINYKDVRLLAPGSFSRAGKIQPRRISGTCALHQRKLQTAIKRARQLALSVCTE